jgi:hypothetical protein
VIECNAKLDLAGSAVERATQFAIGKVTTVKQKNVVQPMFKLYLYARDPKSTDETRWMDAQDVRNEHTKALESFSVHSELDESVITDRGVKVTGESDQGECWMRMIKFFVPFNEQTEEIVVNKKFIPGLVIQKSVSTIGKLTIF